MEKYGAHLCKSAKALVVLQKQWNLMIISWCWLGMVGYVNSRQLSLSRCENVIYIISLMNFLFSLARCVVFFSSWTTLSHCSCVVFRHSMRENTHNREGTSFYENTNITLKAAHT
jgi:hypothetical protein